MSSRARQPLSRANVTGLLRRFQAGENGKYLSLQKNNKNVQTSLKTGFAQIFSCRPKNLSCPKFGGGSSTPLPPGPYTYVSFS